MKAIIDLTDKCNLCCKHCGNRETLTKCNDFNFVKLISSYQPNISSIELLGGEPLLYNDIFNLLAFCDSNKILVSIITNGQNINMIEDLVKYDISSLSVSIDGLREENNFVRGNGTYEKSILFLKKYINKKNKSTKIGINTVINSLNKNTITLFLRKMLKLNVDYIVLNELISTDDTLKYNLDITIKDYYNVIEQIIYTFPNEILSGKIIFDSSNPLFLKYIRLKYSIDIPFEPYECTAISKTIYINNAGNIYPCRTIHRNVNDNNIIKVYEKIHKKIEKSIKNVYCSSCEFLNVCFECPYGAFQRYQECMIINENIKKIYDKYISKKIQFSKKFFKAITTKKIIYVNQENDITFEIPKDYIDIIMFVEEFHSINNYYLFSKYGKYAIIELFYEMYLIGVVNFI